MCCHILLVSKLQELNTSCFCIAGDWNANISNPNSIFGRELTDFCYDHQLTFSSKDMLPGHTSTFVSNVWRTTSWLDNAVSSGHFHHTICNMYVNYEVTQSDHMPVCVKFNCEMLLHCITVNFLNLQLGTYNGIR